MINSADRWNNTLPDQEPDFPVVASKVFLVIDAFIGPKTLNPWP
jgi:hypothetical protein